MKTSESPLPNPSLSADPEIEGILASLSLREKIGHLLCPDAGQILDHPKGLDILQEYPVGSVFFPDWNADLIVENVPRIQDCLKIPALVAADMEFGFAAATAFPYAMGCAATGNPEYAWQRGRATAREARAAGINWSFAPNVDIAMNFRNVDTSIRAWGDTADGVLRYVLPLIRGMQEEGLLAATVKHFPGTGLDDRDQHLCTAVNPLDMDAWMESYGRVFMECFKAGVLAVMPGHIALPSFEGKSDRPADCLPATLNERLQGELLRNQLGFEGVIISDAASMIGFASRCPRAERAVRNLASGGDVFLFGNPCEEAPRIEHALDAGILEERKIDDSVRRVLRLKRAVGLLTDRPQPPPSVDRKQEHLDLSDAIARDAITILRNDGAVPAGLMVGDKVLTVTIRNPVTRDGEQHRTPPLTGVDEELRRHGLQVDHLDLPVGEGFFQELDKAVDAYDRVFINLQMPMHSMIGVIRLVDRLAMCFWEGWWVGRNHIVFTSFGSPYHLYEFPHWPNMVLTYGHMPSQQKAVVQVWLGKRPATGKCPVKMPKEAGPVLE